MSVPKVVIDLVFGFLILLMTYAISSEGLWGARPDVLQRRIRRLDRLQFL